MESGILDSLQTPYRHLILNEILSFKLAYDWYDRFTVQFWISAAYFLFQSPPNGGLAQVVLWGGGALYHGGTRSTEVFSRI